MNTPPTILKFSEYRIAQALWIQQKEVADVIVLGLSIKNLQTILIAHYNSYLYVCGANNKNIETKLEELSMTCTDYFRHPYTPNPKYSDDIKHNLNKYMDDLYPEILKVWKTKE